MPNARKSGVKAQPVFQCRHCRRDFLKSDHLHRHERIHTNDKPFSCPVCHKSFSRKDVLLRHRRVHEPSAGTSEVSPMERSHENASEIPNNDVLPMECEPSMGQRQPNTPISLEIGPFSLEHDFSVPLSNTGIPEGTDNYAGFDRNELLNTYSSLDNLEDDLIDLWCLADNTAADPPAIQAESILSPRQMQNTDDIYPQGPSRTARGRGTRIAAIQAAWFTNWSSLQGTLQVVQRNNVLVAEGKGIHQDAPPLPMRTVLDESYLRDIEHDFTAERVLSRSQMPSIDYMNMCLRYYFRLFYPRFPLIHRASFRATSDNHLLCFAMCAIGSVYIGTHDSTAVGLKLAERVGALVYSKWTSIWSTSMPTVAQLDMLLVAVHLQLFSLITGNAASLAKTSCYHASTLMWARKLGVFGSLGNFEVRSVRIYHSNSDLDREWKGWVHQETLLRIAYALYITDAELSSTYHSASLLRFNHKHITSPSSDSLFEAENASAWRERIAQEQTPYDILAPLDPELQSSVPDQERRLGAPSQHDLQLFMILESISAKIVEQREVDGCSLKPDFQRKVIDDLILCHKRFFQHTRDGSNTRNLLDRNDHLEARMLWHASVIMLLTNMGDIERYTGRDGLAVANSTTIDLDGSTTVQIILHCLVMHHLAESLRIERHLAFIGPRCIFTAGAVYAWAAEHIYKLESGPIKLHLWQDRLPSWDPFTCLLESDSTCAVLQAFLDSGDLLLSLNKRMMRTGCVDKTFSGFAKVLDILASGELGLQWVVKSF